MSVLLSSHVGEYPVMTAHSVGLVRSLVCPWDSLISGVMFSRPKKLALNFGQRLAYLLPARGAITLAITTFNIATVMKVDRSHRKARDQITKSLCPSQHCMKAELLVTSIYIYLLIYLFICILSFENSNWFFFSLFN